jgi:peptidoglycan glycosyltransferase
VNRQIRGVGIVLMALFVALFLQLNYLQVVDAHKLAHDPRNTRLALATFAHARGAIQTSDGVVVAQSVPSNDGFKYQRQYPQPDLFAQITGYFSFTYGTEGVEQTYDSELNGSAQRARVVNPLNLLKSDRQQFGNVTLTLSSKLQQVAKDALGNKKGAVVALDPTNGNILALWSFPSYDPNLLASHATKDVAVSWSRYQADPSHPMLPRAYRERFFPGSTFKVVTSAAALEKAPDLTTKVYPSETSIELPQTNHQRLSNFGGERCGGSLNDILRISCNTAFAQMGLDLGADKLASQAMAFGFDHRPPLDLPAVAQGKFPDASAFAHDLPALAKSAIGQQDVAATPLQMALVAAGVANGGVVMKPHVMAEVRDSEGTVVRQMGAEPWMRAMSAENAARLRDLMIGVVRAGTGTAARLPGIDVAGKTGTAQTGRNTAHAWFIAFAPAAAPKIAIAVIVEDQPGVGDATGGKIAAPIAKAVMQAALAAP